MIGIIGAGLSGMTMALALARAGFDVTLIGVVDAARSDLRTTAILQPNIDFLQALDLWTDMAATATPLMTMELINGTAVTSFDTTEMGLDQFGYNVLNADLKHALVAQIAAMGKKIKWHKITMQDATQTPRGWHVTLQNAKTCDVDLLIGADGRDSAVRCVAGIDFTERVEAQTALVAQFACDKPHHYTSVERYCAGGPVTLVPCAGRQVAVVWCDDADITAARAQSVDKIAAELTTLTENRFGTLRLVGDAQLWPVRPGLAQQLVAHHLALMGEAAHVLPPIGAQGFNTSLYDAQSLLAALQRGCDLGLGLGDAGMLQQYATQRQADVALRFHAITRLNDLIRGRVPMARLWRRLGLGLLQHINPIRQQIMQLALAPRYFRDAA